MLGNTLAVPSKRLWFLYGLHLLSMFRCFIYSFSLQQTTTGLQQIILLVSLCEETGWPDYADVTAQQEDKNYEDLRKASSTFLSRTTNDALP